MVVQSSHASRRPREITPRQRQIASFVVQYQHDTGRPPTRKEIAQHFGFSSRASAQEQIAALERHGVLKRLAGSRGLIVEPSRIQPATSKLTVPIIGRVRAGHPSLAIEDQDGEMEVPTSLFHPRPDLVLRVVGDSMHDAGILEGDLVAVHRTSEARSGQIVVARVDDEIMIKYYARKGGRIVLQPANADYAPLEIDPSSFDFSIEAIVLGVIRRYA